MGEQPTETLAVLDVWGKDESREHTARYYVSVTEALQLAALDLTAGYVITIRVTPDQTDDGVNFDTRIATIH